MDKFTFLAVITTFLLTGCAYNPAGYLKRSANNELIDMKGFNKKKHLPIYNQKYILKAQHNISENNYEEDENLDEDDNELMDPAAVNRNMYKKMLERRARERTQNKGNNKLVKKTSLADKSQNSYNKEVTFTEAKQQIEQTKVISHQQLQNEIEQIKRELQAAKIELENSPCPCLQIDKTQTKRKFK